MFLNGTAHFIEKLDAFTFTFVQNESQKTVATTRKTNVSVSGYPDRVATILEKIMI
jgi:hypothetical protein